MCIRDREGSVTFGDEVIPLPALLQAARRGAHMVALQSGELGLLPEDWLRDWAVFGELGRVEGERLRFGSSQVGLLDALLRSRPQVRFDRAFEALRSRLAGLGSDSLREVPEFRGELRPYQREGLAWLASLRELGLGGCLADDMGLGKTVQVLALLAREVAGAKDASGRPTLVVAPLSVVFNWRREAERFAPALEPREYTGPDRRRALEGLDRRHLVLTTYGTLRRDAHELSQVPFDTVVLDEAQAIKNPASQVARAARLLRADHRLALSGTPVENHLGELWSLFEFLNPGMLGSASGFRRWIQGAHGSAALLGTALRPFLLRRTKERVVAELPEKVEQVLDCELGPEERRLYGELRDHYRDALLPRAEDEGLGRMKIQVLEALLRLRQAACHPGLVDPARSAEPGAKLEVLLPLLAELRERGHKALVFSQFTKLLAIVRAALERDEIPYEYLDGRTRKREERVRRFQEDPDCTAFLISLKAGGTGLNLTAAEYVFVLDPWWNPAVESQAIDRAHRIGQDRRVVAYRLIARGTVEERIQELKAGKRELAEAVLEAGEAPLAALSAQDLARLFS